MQELDYRLKRLFIFSHGLEEMQYRYTAEELYRLLLDEVVELELFYEEYRQEERREKTPM